MRRGFSIEGMIGASAIVVFATLGFFLYFLISDNASRAADEAFDRVLGAAALSIVDTVGFENGAVTVDIPYSSFAILGTSRLNRIFYRVVAPDRNHVTGSPVLALEMPSATGPDLRIADGVMQNEPIRIASVARYRSDAATGAAGWVEVMVAETREAREQLAGQLAFEAAAPAAATAVIAFVVIWMGIRFAFSPLRSVERSLRRRSPSDLTPITAQVPREIEALVVTLNEFMSRLESTLEGLRRVTSDAAHQLRTPLAAIRAQSEIALDDADPEETRRRLRRINANAINASQLTNRWLTDATLLHKLKTRQTEPVDVVEQVREAIDRLHSEGLFRLQLADLDLRLPPYSVTVLADPVSIVEMVRNLVENAFVHAPGETTVEVRVAQDQARIEVCDCGPGIPADRRHAVFERFERASTSPGSGLGLAIAKDVVEASGGTLDLSDNDGVGLRVSVILPLHPTLQPRAGKQKNSKLVRRAKMLPIVLAFVAGVSMVPTVELVAQEANRPIVIFSTMTPERFAPLHEILTTRFRELDIVYQQARSPEIAARVRARVGDEPDIVILPSPDIAVSLTNEGLAARLDIHGVAPSEHWRNELYVVAHDPAVLVFRDGDQSDFVRPQSRLELVQMLEQPSSPLFQRIGIVNVGIDSVSYGLAAQDSLRSPLYWRLARAFGAAEARIYDTGDELVEAIRRGDIDIGYNVPHSTIAWSAANGEVGHLRPLDYVLAMPWVVFAPQSTFRTENREVIEVLLSDELRDAREQTMGAQIQQNEASQTSTQIPDLGPELLVFLDSLKRGAFFDTWFQLVTSP